MSEHRPRGPFSLGRRPLARVLAIQLWTIPPGPACQLVAGPAARLRDRRRGWDGRRRLGSAAAGDGRRDLARSLTVLVLDWGTPSGVRSCPYFGARGWGATRLARARCGTSRHFGSGPAQPRCRISRRSGRRAKRRGSWTRGPSGRAGGGDTWPPTPFTDGAGVGLIAPDCSTTARHSMGPTNGVGSTRMNSASSETRTSRS